jgi:hypothetical protein
MKLIFNLFSKKGLVLCLLMLSSLGFAQATFNISLANAAQTSTTTFEVDVMISVLTPTNGVRLASVSCGINYNSAILNGGTPCTTNNCGSWSQVAGTTASQLSSLLAPTLTLRASAPFNARITMINQAGTIATDVPVGTYRVGRYKFTNTVPFTASSNANLWLQNVVQGGNQNAIVGWFAAGTSTPIANATTITTGATGTITSLSHTSAATYSLILNGPTDQCFTAGTATTTPVSCFGGSNGSATVTMGTPTPSNLNATYSLDGGPNTPVLLTAGGAFTVSGLTAGPHSVSVTNNTTGSCSNIPVVVSFTVGSPTQLVASASAGTIACFGGSTNVAVSATGGTAPYTGTD